MMIADALRLDIEAHAARARRGNPLKRRAAAGELSLAAVEQYLSTLRYMLSNTEPNLKKASERARERGHERLVAYFEEKLVEEVGHERWADRDLEVLNARNARPLERTHAPAAVELNVFLQRTIDRDPLLYVAYIFWAEYFTVLVGGDLVRLLVENCEVPLDALTCLVKHVELDKDHTEENLQAIDELVEDPRALIALRAVLTRSMAFFDRICEEIVEADLVRSSRVAS